MHQSPVIHRLFAEVGGHHKLGKTASLGGTDYVPWIHPRGLSTSPKPVLFCFVGERPGIFFGFCFFPQRRGSGERRPVSKSMFGTLPTTQVRSIQRIHWLSVGEFVDVEILPVDVENNGHESRFVWAACTILPVGSEFVC